MPRKRLQIRVNRPPAMRKTGLVRLRNEGQDAARFRMLRRTETFCLPFASLLIQVQTCDS